ncbi:uncharacterized protein LOC106457333 isoform X2 [Limulus polyphemus]|uniref:Uncharacterized protein LOC106457333 isoform X2 n=1 Tax=Limulus polyphemus TaxID=6850 RepID=A0ABM1S639_LIMPO|nr:uncharacterized protein LOC106457333 isoform X2 [Limulus polyphemus]
MRALHSYVNSKAEDDLQELAELLQLPTDVFAIKESKDGDITVQTVYTKEPLTKGTAFGPYKGRIAKQNSFYSKKLYTDDNDSNEEEIILQIDGENGLWLKLLKVAINPEEANIIITREGNSIWCTMNCDVGKDEELTVWCEISSPLTLIDQLTPSANKIEINLPRFCHPHVKKRLLDKKRVDSPTLLTKPRSSLRLSENTTNSDTVHIKNRSPSPLASSSVTNNSLHNDGFLKRTSQETPNLSSLVLTSEKNGFRRFEQENPSFLSPFPFLRPALSRGGQIICVPFVAPELPNTLNNQDARGVHLVGKLSGFRCVPCGIAFSSQKTLNAHQKFYCSYRQESKSDTASSVPNGELQISQEETKVPFVAENNEHTTNGEEVTKENSSINQLPVDVTGEDRKVDRHEQSISKVSTSNLETFRCPHCLYTTDKKGGLTRHMRIHEHLVNYATLPPASLPPISKYCSVCDIQFCSMNTFQAHKQHYCSNRIVQCTQSTTTAKTSFESSAAMSPNFKSQESSELINYQAVDLVAKDSLDNLPSCTNPTHSLTVMPHLPETEAESITLNSSMSPGTGMANRTSSSINEPNHHKATGKYILPEVKLSPCENSNSLMEKDSSVKSQLNDICDEDSKTKSENDIVRRLSLDASLSAESAEQKTLDHPIDLTIRKSNNNTNCSMVVSEHSRSCLDDKIKDQVKTNSTYLTKNKPHQIYKTEKTTPLDESSSVFHSPHLQIPNSKIHKNSPSNPFSEIPRNSTHSQVLVKQGSSQCKECNIVFYKYENYLIHKKNYCASRQQKTAANKIFPANSVTQNTKSIQTKPCDLKMGSLGSSNEVSAVDNIPQTLPNQPTGRQFYQFFCVACGVKFTSPKNLKAHQTYYCPKRDQTAETVPLETPQGLICSRCKMCYISEDTFRSHPCFVHIQRSMYSSFDALGMMGHATASSANPTEALSFKCIFCGYIGHTVRGMRTHVRAHLERNSTPPEGMYDLSVEKQKHDGSVLSESHQSQTDSGDSTAVNRSGQAENRYHLESTFLLQNENKRFATKKLHVKNASPSNISEDTSSSSEQDDSKYRTSETVAKTLCTEDAYLSSIDQNIKHRSMCRSPVIENDSSETSRSSPDHQAQKETVSQLRINNIHDESSNTVESSFSASTLETRTCNTEGVRRLPDQRELNARSSDEELFDPYYQLVNEQAYWCMLCSYYSKYKGNVVRHIQSAHKDFVNPSNTAMVLLSSSTLFNDTDRIRKPSGEIDPSCLTSTLSKESNSHSKNCVIRIDKKQAGLGQNLTKEGKEINSFEKSSSNTNQPKKQGPKFCKSCNISFKYLSTFIAHKKYYCSSHDGEGIVHEV